MWARFEEMPNPLKFITAHAIFCVVYFLGSAIPMKSYDINGSQVTFTEWWSSGVGVFASIIGVGLPISAYMFLKKIPYARAVYLAISIVSLGQYLLLGKLESALAGGVFVVVVGWYLFSRAPSEYFTSNKSLKDAP